MSTSMPSVEDDIIPPSIDVAMGGANSVSVSAEKGMVWDEELQTFRLMNKDLAKIRIMASRPTPLRYWSIRMLIGFGALAMAGMAATSALWVRDRLTTPPAAIAMAQAPQQPQPSIPTVPATPAAPEPLATTNSAGQGGAPSTSSSPPAPHVAASTPTPTATAKVSPPAPTPAHDAKVKQEPAAKRSEASKSTLAPLPKSEPQKSQPKPAEPEPKPARTAGPRNTDPPAPPVEIVKPSVPSAPAKPVVQAGAGRSNGGWAVRVERTGVIFFDGSAGKLFRVGEVLPNGERLIDVDESSATYATDRGIRQIRSTALQGG